MKVSVYAFSRQGIQTALRIADFFSGSETFVYVSERLNDGNFLSIPKPSRPFFGEQFQQLNAMIFVCSCGIALREIAPFVRDKTKDPAVLCVDELASFVIPILSGHIGGANELARKLADHLGSQAVITTASDINRRFSADAWAARNGFIIDNMLHAKEIAAAILERDIPLKCLFPIAGSCPPGTFPGDQGEIGIYIGWGRITPFEKTLRIIPPVIHLGIGCRKGISPKAVSEAVSAFLDQWDIDPRAIKCAASIDLKAEETGLLDYFAEKQIPIRFYSSAELNAVPGTYSGSDFVKQVTGVDCVCERAAMIGADQLIIKKTVCEGVTLAAAAELREVRFE